MNGVSGRQRRSSVLRCLECNMSFWSLPELTFHMIKTAHYANIVRSSVIPGPAPPEMTSSPTMTSSCSPLDSESSRDSDVDTDPFFRTGPPPDFRLDKSAKRWRDSSPNDDDCAKRSKIWRPDWPASSSGGCSATTGFPTTSPKRPGTPVCAAVDDVSPSGTEHVTSSKERGETTLYARSLDRPENPTEESLQPPALTAMEDFISRSICELDRSKRRPAAMPVMPAPVPPPQPPTAPLSNGFPSPMSVADLMFPLFPLAQFFPEQLLLASRAFNFLPLMQSFARLYGDRFADVPHTPPFEFPTEKIDDFDAARLSRSRTPAGVGRSPQLGAEALKYRRISDGGAEVKSNKLDDGLLRSRSGGDGQQRDATDQSKLSPTSSVDAGARSTALDSLRGFVYGDRKPAAHARADRKYSDGEASARRRQPSPAASPGGDPHRRAASPAGTDCRADTTDTGALTICGETSRTTDYDSRFDKYYRLARELAGQL